MVHLSLPEAIWSLDVTFSIDSSIIQNVTETIGNTDVVFQDTYCKWKFCWKEMKRIQWNKWLLLVILTLVQS